MKVFNGKIISKFNLLARVRQFIDGWKFKTPKEKFFILYSIPKTLIETVGIRLLGDCRVYWYSYIAYGIIVYYLLLVSHTLYYFGSKGQFMTGTRCICGMGILVSTMPLYYKGIGADRFKYRSLMNFAGDYMYQEKRDATRYSMVCDEGVRKLMKSYVLMTFIMCMSFCATAIGPMWHFIRTGQWISPSGTQFPYADQSNVAFYLDLIFQLIIFSIAGIAVVTTEMGQAILNNSVDMIGDVTQLSIIELNEELTEHGKMNRYSQGRFRNIVIQIQDSDRFISDFMDILYGRLLLGPFALAFSTSLSVFAQYAMDFPAGYGVAIASYIQLLILCYMGHNVNTANEKIYDALIELPWYLMSKNDQKDFACVMFRMQNGLHLTIGPFGELNYEMASDITSRIYQCLTILLRLFQ